MMEPAGNWPCDELAETLDRAMVRRISPKPKAAVPPLRTAPMIKAGTWPSMKRDLVGELDNLVKQLVFARARRR
jgi:hypothetical protein